MNIRINDFRKLVLAYNELKDDSVSDKAARAYALSMIEPSVLDLSEKNGTLIKTKFE